MPFAIITWAGFGLWGLLLELQYLGFFWFIVSLVVVPISFFLPLYVGIMGGGWTMALVIYGGGFIGTVFFGFAMTLASKDT